MPKSYKSNNKLELALRDFGLAYPEATEDFPWEHRALKVRNKAFVFLGTNDKGLFVSVKLPESHLMAVDLPFAGPTGYGLGKHGWVSAQFGKGDAVPVGLIEDWIDESYRAVAPKTLVKQLPEAGAPPPSPAKKRATKAAKKRTTKRPAAKTARAKPAKKSPAKKATRKKKATSKKPATKKASTTKPAPKKAGKKAVKRRPARKIAKKPAKRTTKKKRR